MCVSLCELLVPLGAVWMSGQVSDMRQSTQVYCDALSLRPSLISPHINHPTQAAQGSSGGVLSGDHIVSISTTKQPLIVSSENISFRHDEKSSPVKPCQGQLAGTMGSERARHSPVHSGKLTLGG